MEPMGNYEKCTIGLSTGPGVVIQKLTQAKAAGKSVAKSEGVGHRRPWDPFVALAYETYARKPFQSMLQTS